MATIVFYEKPGCANNALQKRLLTDAGHVLIVRNLLAARWEPGVLRSFFGRRPVREWFNRAAPRIKSGEVSPERLDEAAALALMSKDPLLIRRPLLQVGDRREAGFDAELIRAWIGLGTSDHETDTETCRRARHCPPPSDVTDNEHRDTP